MPIETDEQIRARIDDALRGVNATEATWAAWAKAHRVEIFVVAIGIAVTLFAIIKLV